MSIFKDMEPGAPLRFFEEIAGIPRPSYHEEKIGDYLVNFAKERSLEYHRDEIGNVIIIKEASSGCEDKPPVILQGHMDMVAEKTEDCTKDMDNEGLDLMMEADEIYAQGTTLGADDGVALAYALSLLDADDLKHPRLEFVCTVQEEVGMEGASALDVSPLKGHTLINIDSESEGVFTAGCAGGADFIIESYVNRDDPPTDAVYAQVKVSGLLGGHSGQEIDKGRANAARALVKVLTDAFTSGMYLGIVSFEGGKKGNAIPSVAVATVAVADIEALKSSVSETEKKLCKAYKDTDPDICVTVEECSEIPRVLEPLTPESAEKFLSFITALPDGVQTMSRDIEGMVETSLNMGISDLKTGKAVLHLGLRSIVEDELTDLITRLSWIVAGYAAKYEVKSRYPSWQFEKESPLRKKMTGLYKEMFGKEPVTDVIHAGVECGILAAKMSGIDAVSIGPDIRDIHTPNERLSISSFKRTYEFLWTLIERM